MSTYSEADGICHGIIGLTAEGSNLLMDPLRGSVVRLGESRATSSDSDPDTFGVNRLRCQLELSEAQSYFDSNAHMWACGRQDGFGAYLDSLREKLAGLA